MPDDVINGALKKAYNEPYGTSSDFKILAFLKHLRDEGPDATMKFDMKGPAYSAAVNWDWYDVNKFLNYAITRLEEETQK